MSCTVCGQGRMEGGQLIDHPYRHPYTSMGDPGAAIQNSKKDKPPAAASVGRGFGGDPGLRLALIKAGVITHAQLLAAEEEISDARSSGRPAIAEVSRAEDSADRISDPGFGLGTNLRSGHGGGT